jgi:V/A-type H+-transporting ATPase subunit D
MPGLPLNKSSLKQERSRLSTYNRFLPSLDLKRRQLMLELRRAERELVGVRAEVDELAASSREILALLGSVDMRLNGLVRVRGMELVDDNVVGVTLPRLESVDIAIASYSTLAKPFWFDGLVASLRSTLELRARRFVAERRVQLLQQAVRKVTQRVNLFEKVLIPEAEANIKHIQIHLSDAERAAVVRSKITKAKRQGSGGAA